MVNLILRLEGLAVLTTSLFLFHHFEGNWIFFVVFLFTPDISLLGYLKNKKLGATIYNLGHNYILAIFLILVGYTTHHQTILQLGIILMAHVGMDRMLGFGLKYPSNFKDTHMQKV